MLSYHPVPEYNDFLVDIPGINIYVQTLVIFGDEVERTYRKSEAGSPRRPIEKLREKNG